MVTSAGSEVYPARRSVETAADGVAVGSETFMI